MMSMKPASRRLLLALSCLAGSASVVMAQGEITHYWCYGGTCCRMEGEDVQTSECFFNCGDIGNGPRSGSSVGAHCEQPY